MAIVTKVRTEGLLEISEIGTSDVLEFFDDIAVINVTLSFTDGTGTATLETSNSPHASIVDDTAVWVEWGNEDVTILTQDYAIAPNAIRIVNRVATRARLDVRGNYGR
ncbi:MAG: hypothetical protein PF569_08275 [Candidatus Woesearchaeota archaeon]|jgi:hypothetical protein|nr:hypothetical protein [Candidatus Woesearchaeota archaeon]